MAQRLGSISRLLVGVWLAGVTIATFVIIPPYQGLGDAGRIVIVHVPTAWVAVIAFTVSAVYSALYLRRRRPDR
jgi:heme exporter protein C